jgi:hypothetical protein
VVQFLVDDLMVASLVDLELFKKYILFSLRAFVSKNKAPSSASVFRFRGRCVYFQRRAYSGVLLRAVRMH